MSELQYQKANRSDFRISLLATASSLALVSVLSVIKEASAESRDRPAVWIELGGQAERVDASEEAFAPPFAANVVPAGFTSPLTLQRPPRYGVGAEGRLTFAPDDGRWTFSAAVRYGRMNGEKRVHQQTSNLVYSPKYKLIHPSKPPKFVLPTYLHKFSDVVTSHKQSYSVLDFSAGRDVGLGIFGSHDSSHFDLGVRIAQFSSKSHTALKADPDLYYPGTRFKYARHHHSYAATTESSRSVWAVGPTVSWNDSLSIAGGRDGADIELNWGINAGLLFGRQTASGIHQTSGNYFYTRKFTIFHTTVTHYNNPPRGHDRSRAVVVPNLGGFAGVSLNFPNAKVALGYRADFFFAATDGGIDSRRNDNLGFHGPFATIGIGLP